MNIFAGFLLLLFSPALLSAEIPDAFLGKWKSDEALTLRDMNQYDVPDKVRKILEDGMFGRLVVIFKNDVGASYFEDEEVPEFEPYEIIEVGDNSVTSNN